MTFFLDLDGPILDVAPRHWQAYRDVLAELGGGPALPLERYWALKQARAGARAVLGETGDAALAPEHERRWIERVETEAYLPLDRVVEGAADALDALGRRGPRVLVTLRRSREGLLGQLERLGLSGRLEAVLSSGEQRQPRWGVKVDLVRAHDPAPAGWFVGDTETDIEAGRALGLRTAGVLGGVRSRELLERSRPDRLVGSLRELVLGLDP